MEREEQLEEPMDIADPQFYPAEPMETEYSGEDTEDMDIDAAQIQRVAQTLLITMEVNCCVKVTTC